MSVIAFRTSSNDSPPQNGDGETSPAMYATITAGDRRRLMESCQGIVKSLAWKIHQKLPAHVELDDLISYGQVGLAEAARDFDPSRGGKFSTYAYYRVRGGILDGLSQMSWFSRADYHASKYEVRYQRNADDVLETESRDQSEPDGAAEPAQEASSSWLGRMGGMLSMAYLTCGAAAESESSTVHMADPSAPMPAAGVLSGELRELVEKSIAALPVEAATLIRAAYYEGVSLQEAGNRLGISRAWASRLHARALERLGRSLREHWAQ